MVVLFPVVLLQEGLRKYYGRTKNRPNHLYDSTLLTSIDGFTLPLEFRTLGCGKRRIQVPAPNRFLC